MASYQIVVQVNSSTINTFQRTGYRLCCAFGFKATGSSKVRYNIVAWAEEPSPINTISWSDEYHLAACKNGIEKGSYASPNTPPSRVKPGDTYTVSAGWEVSTTTPNPAAATSNSSSSGADEIPPLRFANNRRASAMVFKRVRNRVTPAFILSMGTWPLEKGRYEVEPSGTLVLFFAAAEPSTTFELSEVPMAYYELDYTKAPRADVVYTAEGDWRVVTMAEDGYTAVSDAVNVRDWSRNPAAKI